jgi:co-chaperonin GroES (HSP10)
MENNSGITPCGHRILVLPEDINETTESGIVVFTEAQKDREALAQMYGIVVSMGNTCYADQPSPWCSVGNRVSFAKYSGLIYTGLDGKTYRCINDLDVVAIVEAGVK